MFKLHGENSNNSILERAFHSAHHYIEDLSNIPVPLVNVIDGGGVFFVEAALPGVAREDIAIEIHGDQLTISGSSRIAAQEEAKTSYLRHEMHMAAFNRTIPLPAMVDGENGSATFANGLLTITLNKKDTPVEKPCKIEIQKNA